MMGIQTRAAAWHSPGRATVILAMTLAGAAPAAVGASEAAAGEAMPSHEVRDLKITVLVTNLAGDPHAGDGEWGYSALVEVDGHQILYDTGASADMVLKNARALHIDLSDVEDVVLSHNHWDHVGGLVTLRREFAGANSRAMSRVHVGARIFEPRFNEAGRDLNGLRLIKAEYLATGGAFVVHDKPAELFPGVWFTGPVPRSNPEKNWNPGLWLVAAGARVEDNVPEDSALVFDTDKGTVILTGCGHAGIVNIADYARTIAGQEPLLAVAGGLHLFAATDQTLAWTGAKLRTHRIENIVSAAGSSFTLGGGIDPRALAR